MVGEEGRAQVTAGYRQTTEEANETHPLFSFLGVYGLPHINSKQFLAVMRVGNDVLDSFSNEACSNRRDCPEG
jgi:phosphoglycerate dehydrogenase-like enzyme